MRDSLIINTSMLNISTIQTELTTSTWFLYWCCIYDGFDWYFVSDLPVSINI